MIPLATDQYAWGFACGRISALEGSLLSTELFQSLVVLERTEDIFHRLQDTFLREWMVPGAVNFTDWTATIDDYFQGQAMSLRKDLPEPALANLFLLSYDYLNLKRAVLGQTVFPFTPNLFPAERLTAVAAGDSSLLPAHLRPVVAALANVAGSETGSAVVDLALDGAYLRHLLDIGETLDNPLVNACLNDLALGQAILALWRTVAAGASLKLYDRHFLPLGKFNGILLELIASSDVRTWRSAIPGEIGDCFEAAQQVAEEEQMLRFDQLLSNHIMAMAQQGKLQTSGPERVFGYLWGLSVEAYNLKVLISGRINGISPDVLKSRLRTCYV